MRTSFRVATVFTGAAALAGGLGPTAFAVPAQAATARPDIGPWRECGANNGGVSNWVHLYYPGDDHPAECIGGAGHAPTNATVSSFCPGNNNGHVYGSVKVSGNNYVDVSFPFAAGQSRAPFIYYDDYNGPQHVNSVSITGWTGNAKCT
jgi:hypothetical protein